MKTCGYCGNSYDDKEPKCPQCGATLLKHTKGAETSSEEYKRLKEELTAKRKSRSKILAVAAAILVLIVVIIISSIVGFFNDPQRAIAKESKVLLKQAEQLVDEGNYASAVDVLNQINREWDDYSTTNQIRQKAERGVMLEKIGEYQKSGNYEQLVAYVDSKISNVEADPDVYEIYAAAKQKVKEKLLAEMTAYMSSGDYFGAIQYFHKVGDSLANDSETVTVYNNAVDAYANAVIQEAEAHAQAGDYASAQAVLSTAQNYIGWVTDLADKAYELDVREVSEEAKAYVNVGNYKDAILYLNDHLDVVYGNPDLEAKLSTYTEKYRANVLSEAASAYKSSGYEAAVSILNEAINVLGYDDIIAAEQNKYEAMKPIWLSEMEVFSFGYEGKYNADFDKYTEDRYGNTYSTSFSINDEDTITWLLNGKYEKMTGTLACPKGYDYESNYSNVIVTIYCDGNKVFTSKEMGPNEKAQSFSLDLTGVEELEIRWQCLESWNIWHNWCAYGTIFDGTLYPKS